MKKTIIALMALAGVAMASETITWNQLTLDNTDIQKTYEKDGTTTTTLGNAKEVTIEQTGLGTLKAGSAALGWSEAVTLDDSWKLTFTLYVNRDSVSAQTLFSDSAFIDTSWNNYSSTGTHKLTVTADGALSMNGHTSDSGLITAKTDKAITLVFIAKEDTNGKDLGGTFYVYVGNEGENSKAVISYDVDARVEFTENTTTRLWTNGGLEQFSNISLSYSNAVTIPEPATATLSLLALAGLAARRRRK